MVDGSHGRAMAEEIDGANILVLLGTLKQIHDTQWKCLLLKYAIEPSYLVTFRADYRNKRHSLDYRNSLKISSLNYLHHGNFTTTNVS